ncbi:MAG: YegS/Rv2252/BmrU family lipid kinase [Bacteroidetes bacterium]|nr:YegS/Rv2252/BmrU family lipid kinase [Bacteroidota bacterium]
MPENSILFLINGKAGHGLPKNFEKIIASILKAHDIEFKISFSAYPGHLKSLAIAGVDEGFKTIVVVGGDGSINEAFSALLYTDVKLGIIPLGSGNGLARHLKIPIKFEQALALIVKGNSKLIDSAILNGIPYLSIAGTGFDALVAKHFAKSKTRGFLAYFTLTIKHYFSYKPIKYQITTDNEDFSTNAMLISFSNSNQFGYNISLAPQAVIDDGLLDICVIQKPTFFALPLTAYYLLTKKINKSKYYKRILSKNTTIVCSGESLINVDGEYIEPSKEIKVQIMPLSINILIP